MITSWHNGATSLYSIRYDTGGTVGVVTIVDNSEVTVNRPNNGSNVIVNQTSGITSTLGIVYISIPV